VSGFFWGGKGGGALRPTCLPGSTAAATAGVQGICRGKGGKAGGGGGYRGCRGCLEG
jgi:hypothetical protein